MEVDSFRYLSSLIKRYYRLNRVSKDLPVPFTPLAKPVEECRFGLVKYSRRQTDRRRSRTFRNRGPNHWKSRVGGPNRNRHRQSQGKWVAILASS